MKPIALILLFGLCTMVGMQIAAQKTERYQRISGLLSDLSTLTETFEAGMRSLPKLAENSDGELFERLRIYLASREQLGTEKDAAAKAADAWPANTKEHQALVTFFTGLSAMNADQIKNRIEQLTRSLEAVQLEAGETAKQAKTIRAVSVLIGTGICILLL